MRVLTKSLVVAAALAMLTGSTALAAGGGGTGADVQVSGSASTGSPTASTPFSYTFQVKDSGPDAATTTIFTDSLPAGFVYNYATANGTSGLCSVAANTVTCNLGTIANGTQSTVVINVTAPATAGTFSNTGTATSSVSDPQPANNSFTVTVKTATCALTSGQTIMNGMVMVKYTNSLGLFEDFQFQANGINYTVITNFYDGTRPLTQVINLNCKQVPVSFIQVGNFVTAAGTVGSATLPGSTSPTPIITASLVQVPYLFDKI